MLRSLTLQPLAFYLLVIQKFAVTSLPLQLLCHLCGLQKLWDSDHATCDDLAPSTRAQPGRD